MTSILNFKRFVRTMPLLRASDGKTNNDFALPSCQCYGVGEKGQRCKIVSSKT